MRNDTEYLPNLEDIKLTRVVFVESSSCIYTCHPTPHVEPSLRLSAAPSSPHDLPATPTGGGYSHAGSPCKPRCRVPRRIKLAAPAHSFRDPRSSRTWPSSSSGSRGGGHRGDKVGKGKDRRRKGGFFSPSPAVSFVDRCRGEGGTEELR